MKVMVIVKASPSSEAGKMPSEELMAAMGSFNEELIKAGIMESGDGLKPSCEGLRVRFEGQHRTVTKGPFVETNELIAGYWVWNVSSTDEALEWVKKCPKPMEDDSDIEIRPFFELDDFAEADPSGDIREQETILREKLLLQRGTLNPYLFFTGRCEEALDYYAQHLAAIVHSKMRISDSPEPIPEGAVPPNFDDKIMHSEFTVCGMRLFATDCGSTADYQGFSLALTYAEEETVRKVFGALAEGGKVDMPLSPMHWSPLYGQVTDKFGIAWMVMLPAEDA